MPSRIAAHNIFTYRNRTEFRGTVTEQSQIRVLVVDDERDITEMYAHWLEDHYAVDTATDGTTALQAITEDTDVVLLDRRMPNLTGDEVLETIRDRDHECRVAMVTGVQPDSDVIEMGFDDYLVKPIDKHELRSTIEALHRRASYDRSARELYALAAKRATLRAEGDYSDDVADAIDEIDARIEELHDESTATVTEFDTTDFRAVFRDITAPEQSI